MEKRKWFVPSLSFNGVAFIAGTITCAVFFGRLSQKVDMQSEMLSHHEQAISGVRGDMMTVKEDMAVLKDRTRKP